MKIRKGKVSDAKALLKILTSTNELQAGEDVGVYDLIWMKNVLSKQKDNFSFILEDKGKIAGFIIAHYLRSVGQVIINDTYVNPIYRRRGLASRLTLEIEKFARKKKVKNITSLIQTSNKKMQHLKEKLGYKRGEALYFYEKLLK